MYGSPLVHQSHEKSSLNNQNTIKTLFSHVSYLS